MFIPRKEFLLNSLNKNKNSFQAPIYLSIHPLTWFLSNVFPSTERSLAAPRVSYCIVHSWTLCEWRSWIRKLDDTRMSLVGQKTNKFFGGHHFHASCWKKILFNQKTLKLFSAWQIVSLGGKKKKMLFSSSTLFIWEFRHKYSIEAFFQIDVLHINRVKQCIETALSFHFVLTNRGCFFHPVLLTDWMWNGIPKRTKAENTISGWSSKEEEIISHHFYTHAKKEWHMWCVLHYSNTLNENEKEEWNVWKLFFCHINRQMIKEKDSCWENVSCNFS